MTTRDDVRDFLVSRRARITPAMVGLPSGGSRRVAGLRRGEVAILAGVSVEYYTKLERGDLRGVSDEVLEAIAGALRFTEAEHRHLFDLARTANAGAKARKRATTRTGVRPSLLHLLTSITDAAAVLGDRTSGIVAANSLARALYDPLYRTMGDHVTYARYIFFDPSSQQFYPDWEDIADASVASLRTVAGRNPFDREISDLVGELSTRSEAFRVRWARHDVRLHIEGVKRIQHPAVGLLELEYNTLVLPGDEDLTLTVYTAAPGSDSADRLRLLATWWATENVQNASTTTAEP
ncbi:helix-turn-helix transcriptional regulator [Demequina capsici]|uniref:Helix-turn-helix transcriptional regulator n=1 Tax=Demequina capsici TaxID=3075620 RepID=A0AA96F8L8_9MICO|nr:helix-turn-helix transcriptional regulator [Demequina sp. OYTSA14]WNM25584.1 helix-turn-helix transcriptional regulator [Demequina sp. OYTSA14]